MRLFSPQCVKTDPNRFCHKMYMHWLKVKPKTFVFMTVRIEKKIDEDFQIDNDLCCEWVTAV